MYPVLFQLGGIPVYGYGAMRVLGFALAIWLLVIASRRLNEPFGHAFVAAAALVFGAFVASKLAFVVLNADVGFSARLLFSWTTGFIFTAGVPGGALAVLAVALVSRRHVGATFDVITPSLVGSWALGDVGCFLAGCCVGAPTSVPWATRFTAETTPLELRGVPVHPVQLYLFAAELLVLALLLAWPRRFRGELALRAIVGLAAVKVVLIGAGIRPGSAIVAGLHVGAVAVAGVLLAVLRPSPAARA